MSPTVDGLGGGHLKMMPRPFVWMPLKRTPIK